MLKRRLNIVILGIIILCSTSFYQFMGLGPLQKGSEMIGGVLIIVLIIFHLVYSTDRSIKKNYSGAIYLILLALITSMVAAYVIHDQKFIQTLFAQRAIYYYFLYFLLHQLKFDARDLEKLVIFFAIVYVGMHFLQTIVYPRIIFNAIVYQERGTLRIYTSGADYIALAFIIAFQKFLRENRFKHLILILIIIIIYIMRGGRHALAIQAIMVVSFIIIDRKVRSRFFLIFLGIIGSFAIFILFQNIFIELILKSQYDASLGGDYTRFQSARFYLNEFHKSPISHITGNGMYFQHSSYGRSIAFYREKYHYVLGDIGLMGNYAMYGLFFLIGVFTIIIRSFRLKIQTDQVYSRYYFVGIVLGLATSGGFGEADYIGLVVCVLYMLDHSNHLYREQHAELKEIT